MGIVSTVEKDLIQIAVSKAKEIIANVTPAQEAAVAAAINAKIGGNSTIEIAAVKSAFELVEAAIQALPEILKL